MYERYFCLPEPAFSPTPDPRFLWLSETHEEGLAALRHGIARHTGFVLLTGGIGAGKTTLLRAALRGVSKGAGGAAVTALVVKEYRDGTRMLLRLFGEMILTMDGNEHNEHDHTTVDFTGTCRFASLG